jgi:two-component system phosphate regulon response regulator OmpR
MLPENAPDGYNTLPHVLIVDDDARIRSLVSRYLSKNGFVILEAESAAQAREMLKRFEFDALIVDIMMPGETGLEFTASLRKNSDLPVLLLTALGEASDRIAGFEQGADDYLPKPFEPRELVLRLHALLRRRPKPVVNEGPLDIGVWRYDPEYDELVDRDSGDKVRLTSVEVNLLKALAARSGEVISREDLARMCSLDAGERTIDVQVTRLRRKLGEDSRAPRYLQTVRGKGYILKAEKV